MLQHPVPHRCADGSVRFTHCHGEYEAALDVGARVYATTPSRGRHGWLRVFGLAMSTATAAFWGVMLLSPPVTEAFNTPVRQAPCLALANEVAPWFKREIQRRAGLGNAAFERGGFKLMLLDYQSARAQCMSGHIVASAHGFRQLTERLATLSERDEPDER